MLKNLSVTKKVFLLTALMFSIYILLTQLGQIIFYGKFYTYYKREELVKQVETFAKDYSELTDSEDINTSLVDFSKNSDAYILIMSEQGNIMYTASYEMTIKTDDGNIVKLSIDNAVRDKSFNNLNIRVGDTISTAYYIADNQITESNVHIPIKIKKNNSEWVLLHTPDRQKEKLPPAQENTDIPLFSRSIEPPPPIFNDPFKTHNSTVIPNDTFPYSIIKRGELNEVNGVVQSIILPDEHNFQSSVHKAESAHAAFQWMTDIYNGKDMQIGERIHYIYQNDSTSSKYIVVIKKIETNNIPQMIFAVNTLKSVDEAVEVMHGSLPIWIVFALLMVTVISIVFSQLITRPILNIMQVTKKMKNLDFSQKCAVQSDDEVGQLADNINDMSEKLDTTIRELIAANEKLTNDIEFERKAELTRREFVAAVSHELKTPLAIIRAYSEGIADGISGEKRDKYLNVIIQETKKMDALVLDMLENSRLESGTQKVNIKTYNISDMTERIVKRFKNGMENKGVNLIFICDEDNIQADFDRNLLEQVMNNFITNAVIHTPTGKKIYISIKKTDTGVLFSVENEGSHIDENIIDKVWDRFFKADRARDRTVGGTGLGLSIAKNILVLHKAEYGVENTDIGVKFWFKL